MTILPAISPTPSTSRGQLLQDLSANQSQQATLEQQLASGTIVNQPSDNPAVAAQVLQLNAGLARAGQYVSNAKDGAAWLSVGTSTLDQVLSTLQSAQQTVLGLSGANLTGQQAALAGASSQIDSIRQQLIALANTAYNGQAIFAGTGSAAQSSVAEAYDGNGNYVGGGSPPTRTVSQAVAVPVAATGPDVFGSGSSGLLGPTGILATLGNDIRTGTPASLQQAETTDLAALQGAISQVESQAATLGASYQRIQGFTQQATNAQAALQAQLSSLDGVNVAQATTELTSAQQSYQSALWAIAQVHQQSLVQYLA